MKRKSSVDLDRRGFLLSTAGLAGAALPGLSWAASSPCPPSSLSVTGGTSTATSCSAGGTAPGELPLLRLSGGGDGKPWTFGQAFRKGDVPAHLGAAGASAFQADVRTRWTDGSVKFAVVSGIGGTDVQFVQQSSPSVGRLTEGQLAAALPMTTIQVGSHTTTLNSLVGTAARQRTVYEGPVMSNWIYRNPILGVGTDLTLWIDVRHYANGATEIFPWVENAHLRTTNPTNAIATATVTIGGSNRFSQSIDFKARTRVPLLSGTALSHWVGADPGITPAHDPVYLKATRLVPNYSATLSSSRTSGLTTSYTPNTLAGIGSSMGAAGGAGAVDSLSTIWYTLAPSAASYRAAVVFGLSAGSWSIHHRSSTTNEPFSFADEANTSYAANPPAVGTGGSNGAYAGSHAPGFAYIPYLVTGRWWFMEELQFIANQHFLDYQSSERFGADAIVVPTAAGSQRLAAWTLRAYAQALVALPDSHPRRNDLVAAWEANCQYWRNKFVDGVPYKTSTWTAVSPQGAIPGYENFSFSATSKGTRGFMLAYLPVVWGTTWDYELPLSSTGRANHQVVRDHLYKHAVGRAGKRSGSGFNWRHIALYDYPIATVDGSRYLTFAQSHAEMKATLGWTAESDNDADGLTLFQHSSESSLTNASGLPYAAAAAAGVALAVDHGFAGASSAWARITGASNYSASLGAYQNAENPTFALAPR